MNKKITSFTDLFVWKEAHKLVLMIYEVTKDFPKEEIYGLTNQLRRAGVSIVSNIAEGFSKGSYKDKLRFYYQALGSLTEIQSQLLVARDVHILNKKDFDTLAKQTISVHKILNTFIAKTKSFNK